jgi:hypothetical protein
MAAGAARPVLRASERGHAAYKVAAAQAGQAAAEGTAGAG